METRVKDFEYIVKQNNKIYNNKLAVIDDKIHKLTELFDDASYTDIIVDLIQVNIVDTHLLELLKDDIDKIITFINKEDKK